MPVKDKHQYTFYLSNELSQLLCELEKVWQYRSRSEFFEDAIRNGIGMMTMNLGRGLQKRVGRAVKAHHRAIEEI